MLRFQQIFVTLFLSSPKECSVWTGLLDHFENLWNGPHFIVVRIIRAAYHNILIHVYTFIKLFTFHLFKILINKYFNYVFIFNVEKFSSNIASLNKNNIRLFYFYYSAGSRGPRITSQGAAWRPRAKCLTPLCITMLLLSLQYSLLTTNLEWIFKQCLQQ